jgi:hypothetical protein
MAPLLPQRQLVREPDRMLARVDPSIGFGSQELADYAVDMARSIMPKVTGGLSNTLRPIHGIGYFGIQFPDKRVWFLERGTRPHTMHNLAGKTIPMWIDDPTSRERKANPKAKTRTTVDGRTQVQIFRRAGEKGKRTVGGTRQRYPGAPGRIARREAPLPLTTAGRTGGRIARGNVGVAWRNPGITGREFLTYAMNAAIEDGDVDTAEILLLDAPTFFTFLRA